MKTKRPRFDLGEPERLCQNCANWLLERKTVYDDGSEVSTYKSPEGKGNCQVLNFDTVPDFGCISFKAGDHVEITHKSGTPWQNWRYDICPSCNGRGNPGDAKPCMQCYGTGRVRYYDDGFIGEERTRLHPKESPPPPAPEIVLRKIDSKEGLI